MSEHGKCPECGARRLVTGSGTIERHTRKIKGKAGRSRCHGTNQRPS